MIILAARPDDLRIEVGGRRATLPGWSMPSPDDIEFHADRADISHWEDGTAMSNAIREEILANLASLAAAQGVRITIVHTARGTRPPWNTSAGRDTAAAHHACKV